MKTRTIIVTATAVVLFLTISSVQAGFVESWSTGGDVEDWIGAGGAALTTNPGSGGNPGGYLRAERTGGFAWVSNARTTPELNGDLFAQHGDELILTVDYALFSPDDFVGGFFARFYSDAGTGDWRAEIPAPGDKQVMTDGWITYTIPLNKNWTDEEAVAAGWNDNGASASFADHFSALTTTGNNDVASFGLNDAGAAGSIQAFDNFGYISVPEPTALMMLLGAALLAASVARRRA